MLPAALRYQSRVIVIEGGRLPFGNLLKTAANDRHGGPSHDVRAHLGITAMRALEQTQFFPGGPIK
jgi:hypothetical protein